MVVVVVVVVAVVVVVVVVVVMEITTDWIGITWLAEIGIIASPFCSCVAASKNVKTSVLGPTPNIV